MARRIPATGFSLYVLAGLTAFLFLFLCAAPAQQLAKRLILKDGSYQLATKWEAKGDRVRYFSAERGEWEEVPKSMVDWAATDKYEKDRATGVPLPEAEELDKELAAERQAEEAKSPQVAPGLRLPADAGVMLLDTYENQPQLVEVQQNSGEINQDKKQNILRAAINPVASAKENIELPGAHARIQAHAALPAIYVNLSQQDQAVSAPNSPSQPDEPWDRFRIVRMQSSKQGKRIVGDIKVAIYGKVKQEQKLIPTTAERLNSGWVKVTPNAPLMPGEYAVIEMLGKEGINLYVWDFGVNPAAPANGFVVKPEPSAPASTSNQRPDLKKRP
jgi:hypothetical protein